MDVIPYFGQLLIGLVFVSAATLDIVDRDSLITLLEKKHVPFPRLLLPPAIAIKLFGGLALIFNVCVPIAAFFLAAFLLVANVIFHNFWSCPSDVVKREFNAFIMHVAIIGGLLLLLS